MQSWQRVDDGTDSTEAGFRTIIHKQFVMNSGKTIEADITGPDGYAVAGIIGLTTDNKVIIARQFRCGPERIMDEIPAGLVDEGETPEAAARRELKEEVGYEADELEYLGSLHADAWSNLDCHYYFARKCWPAGQSNPEETEEIEIDTISISQFISNAKQGLMSDAQGVLLVYDKLMEIEGGL